MSTLTIIARGLTAVTALALAPLATATVPAPWGAIAYSPSDGLFGIAQNAVEREAAQQAALGSCAVQAGGRSCRVVVTFHDACGALAVSDNGIWGADFGVTPSGDLMPGINAAYSRARQQCEDAGGINCRFEQATCSFAAPQ
jgi:hypothetical protein